MSEANYRQAVEDVLRKLTPTNQLHLILQLIDERKATIEHEQEVRSHAEASE